MVTTSLPESRRSRNQPWAIGTSNPGATRNGRWGTCRKPLPKEVKPEKAQEISADGKAAKFGLKKNRQPTEETFDRSVTGGLPRKNKEEKEMMKKFFAKMSDEKGQGLVEYALILVLISVVCIIALTAIGTNANTVFEAIRDALVAA